MRDLNLGDTQLILDYCRTHGILRNQTAYILATTFWETAHTMEPVEEAFYLQARYKWTDERMDRWRKENLRYYPWHGRGYTQTTWERNYQRLKLATGVDVVADPSAAMRPDVAVVALVDGIMGGWWTGKKLGDYVSLKRSDYVGARRCVNGVDDAQAIAEVARDYEETLLSIGYGVEKAPPVINEKRDGTEPRESKTESQTLRALVRDWLGTLGITGSGIWLWWQEQTPETQSTVYIAGAILLVGLMLSGEAKIKIWSERLKKWYEGDR